MWTRFMDMCSGGGLKEKFSYLYIEAPEDEAKSIFYSRFDHNPNRISCTCCGEDYSISCKEDLKQLTGYDRKCIVARPNNVKGQKYFETKEDVPSGWTIDKYSPSEPAQPLEKYLAQDYVEVIYAKDIKDEERNIYVPEEGYVWL